MPLVEIRIPQLGEGLQEARLIRFLKHPGERVERDEPIFEMETDKAVMEIESPAAGTVMEWTAREDEVLPIGTVIGRIETEAPADTVSPREALVDAFEADHREAVSPVTPLPREPRPPEATPLETPQTIRNAQIPPRTRAYAREKGVSDEELSRLAETAGGRLLPEDVDRYLELRASATAPPAAREGGFQDVPLSQRQRTLVYRLQRATQGVIPATMEMRVDWSGIEEVRARIKREGHAAPQATQFILFAWCVAQAARAHPAFRSALLNETTLRQYDHLNLGIAVARPGDELLLARVDAADSLPFAAFVVACEDAIHRARDGEDQASDTMQLSLTHMAAAGVRLGIPVVAAPAVGTLFVGEPFDEAYPLAGGAVGFRRQAAMVLSFDHRIANGIGAAAFLADVKRCVESIRDLSTGA